MGRQRWPRKLLAHYRETPTGKFDSNLVGERMFDRPIEVVHTEPCRPSAATPRRWGRHLDGCRIGFRPRRQRPQVAAVIDGKVVFSDETVWDPYFQPDPQYHYAGIMDSLKKAAAHLPRVDAIGGQRGGRLCEQPRQGRLALPRGAARRVHQARPGFVPRNPEGVNNIPLEVVNDGEVTALAGSMSLGKKPHPGHFAGHKHRRRLRERRGQHHFLA